MVKYFASETEFGSLRAARAIVKKWNIHQTIDQRSANTKFIVKKG